MGFMDTVTFILTHLSFVFCIVLFILTFRVSKRSLIRTAFYSAILLIFIWNLGTLLDMYYQNAYGESNMLFVCISYLGICFSPLSILFLGATISRPHLTLKPAHSLLLLVPCASMIVICTNSMHHLFFVNFSVFSQEAIYGAYFYFHSVYSYACILVGVVYLITFSVKNSGFFSKQSLLLLLGIAVTLLANVFYSFNVLNLTFNINACMLTATLLCFAVAFYKYDYLKVSPVAINSIVDLISDGYIVTDVWRNVVGYNRALLHIIGDMNPLEHKTTMEAFMDRFCPPGTYGEYVVLQEQAIRERNTVSVEYAARSGSYYFVEITPIYTRRALIGTVILLKDITQSKKDMETIKKTHASMIERERLAFLGTLIAGIAHNLRTAILSISGSLEGMVDLVTEYDDSIDDAGVTAEDHHEIARDMFGWIEKIKEHCAYVSDMVSTVKGQTIQVDTNDAGTFTIDDFLKRVDLLMKNELSKSSCTLRTQIKVDTLSHVTGNMNSLVQVFNNLIVNAIDSYEGIPGFIDLEVNEDSTNYIFVVADSGKGIEPSLQAKLFKEMVTTKGKNGTGLGLYLSYATIKGHFGGDLTLNSKVGRGTAFTVTLPKNKVHTEASAF